MKDFQDAPKAKDKRYRNMRVISTRGYIFSVADLRRDYLYTKKAAERMEENSYRRGYWDGVFAATELLDRGATNRQLKYWLWNKLMAWRRISLNQSPEPPTIEPWKKQRKRILKHYNHKCVYCGSDATHVDHVVPVSRDGSYDDDNLVAACKNCNLAKGSKTVDEWLFGR